MTNGTAVYIWKLVQPNKPITDSDNDKAHIDKEAEKVIHFMHSTKEHQFMIDKILRKDQGLTFDVFNEPEQK